MNSSGISNILQRFKAGRGFLGVEISDQSIKLVDLKFLKNNRPNIKSIITEPLKKESIVDGRILDPLHVSQTISQLLLRHHIKTKNIHFVLPSSLTVVRMLKLPDIPEKDLRKLIDFEVKHNIHLPFEDPFYDFVKINTSGKEVKRKISKSSELPQQKQESDIAWQQAAVLTEEGSQNNHSFSLFNDTSDDTNTDSNTDGKDEAAEETVQCDVMLVSTSRKTIDEYSEVIRHTGLHLLSIEIKALSIFRAIKYTQMIDHNETFLTVDVNMHDVDFSIFHQGELKMTRNAPFHFVEDSEAAFEKSADWFSEYEEDAENSHRVTQDMADELDRMMNFYRYTLNNRDHEFKYIVLSGDIVDIQSVYRILQERLTPEVVLFEPNKLRSDNEDLQQMCPEYMVPIGLALRGKER